MFSNSMYIPRVTSIINPKTATDSILFNTILGYKGYNVPKDLGLSHHYRICEFGGFECMKNPSIDDNSAQKWGKFLIPNVQKRCSDIFGKFGCPEAPELGSPW